MINDEKLDKVIIEYKRVWNTKGWIPETRDSLAALALSDRGIEIFGDITTSMEKLLDIVKKSSSEQEVINTVMRIAKSK